MTRPRDFRKIQPRTWLIVSLLVLLASGCGGSAGVDNIAPGTLGVSLTDTPACGFDNVYVTVNKVRVHESSSATESDGGWTDIVLDPPQKIDLLSLNNGALVHLGEASLPAGHYTQLRLVLDSQAPSGLANSVVVAGGSTETQLVTASGIQSGIKLINEFDVPSGQRVDLMLDFNACKSIVKRGDGSYVLKPVIRLIPYVLNGIRGFVDPALFGSNAIATAQQGGNVIQSTAPMSGGAFFLTRLEPGIYDVAFTADGHVTAIITGVPVSSTTSILDVSTVSSPITLPSSGTNYSASGTVTLSPASATELAYVSARQSLDGTIITVKSTAANDVTGAYSLTLPVDAPWVGKFLSTLPVDLAARPAVAGYYTLDASANGYQTAPLASVSLSSGDVIGVNFTLMP